MTYSRIDKKDSGARPEKVTVPEKAPGVPEGHAKCDRPKTRCSGTEAPVPPIGPGDDLVFFCNGRCWPIERARSRGRSGDLPEGWW